MSTRELLLLGDSLLAEVGWRRTQTLEDALGPAWRTFNCATSGFTAAQSLEQAPVHARMEPAAVLVSLGTNDASIERQVTVEAFTAHLADLLVVFDGTQRVLLLPPGLHDEAAVDPYRAAARHVAVAVGAPTIDGRELAETVRAAGGSPFVEDGVHFADAMYDALADELAALLR